MDNIELYFEEQRQQLKLLIELTQKQIEIYKAPEDVKIEGKVEISNPQTEMVVTNLEALKAYFDDLAVQLTEAIEKHATAPVNEVSVKNQPTTIAISNQIDTTEQLERIFEAIKNKELSVKVQKSDIVFPKNPKDAIPVRLVDKDGKQFYTALFQAVSSNSVPRIDVNGTSVVPIANADGSAIGSATTFAVNDIEDDTTSYFGKTSSTGAWQVLKVTDTYVQYASETNNAGVTTYTDAWANRASLTYGRFDEV